MIRSYLFVPADSERKFARATESEADAIIIDLEDSVAPDRKDAARRNLEGFLSTACRPELWVRINPLTTTEHREDVEALAPAPPKGVVLPKSGGADDVRRLDAMLDAMEAEAGRESGRTRILPLVTETPAALFAVAEYADAGERLSALTWGAEDLAAALGAQTNRDPNGQWLAPYALARTLCLLGAAAAGLPAVETVFTRVRDTAAAGEFAALARRDGFSGMLVLHPAQLGPVHDAFTPTDAEIEHARRVVELFDNNPGEGVAMMDGEMVDRPHYLQARRILDVADRIASG